MASSEIDRQASEWIVRLDKEAPASVRADFEAWYAADVRHQAAYLRQLEAWKRLDRLQVLRPPRIERRRRPVLRRWLLSGVAAAAAALFVGGYALRGSLLDVGETKDYATGIGGFERVVLSDGSVLELNTDSQLHVDLDRERRIIRLERGEATFRVAHDAQRPFLVMVGGTVVRAIGTQFNVRRRDSSVEVMVVEGVVALGSLDTLGKRASIPQPTTPVVSAGKIAIAEPTGLKLHEVAQEEVQRTLAWQNGMLSFNGQTLVEAAEEFNRYNRRKVVVADPALASLRIGGQFRATNIDTFAAVLEQKFGIRVTEEIGQIVLRGSAAATPLTQEYRKVTQ
jgi:transmembrane sensor